MKASDIVTQLSVLLPQLTDKFTDSVGVSNIIRTGADPTVVMVTCLAEHGLEPDQAVAIKNTQVYIPINTFLRSGTVGTLTTDGVGFDGIDHDFVNNALTVTVTGASGADVNFNGTFTIINVDNRITIRVTMVDSGSTAMDPSGNTRAQLHEAYSRLRTYNNTYKVESVPTPTTFTIIHSDTTLPNPTNKEGLVMTAEANPRISSGVDIDRIISAYTQKAQTEYWAFVVLGDAVASQSRLLDSDATDNQQRDTNYRQQIVEPFTVYIFIPVENEIAARESRDEIDEIFRPLLRSLLFSKFSTGLYADKLNTVQFTGHGLHNYNAAVYIHQFSFAQVAEIYEQDTVGPDIDVAFRNIDFTIFRKEGTQVDFMKGTPNLDDT